jgi:hypothetical protein
MAIDPFSQAGLALASLTATTKNRNEMAIAGSFPIELKQWPKGQVVLKCGTQPIGQGFRVGNRLITAKHVLDAYPDFDIHSGSGIGVYPIKNCVYSHFGDVAVIQLTQIAWAALAVQQIKISPNSLPAASISADVGLGWSKSVGRVEEPTGFQSLHYISTESGYSGAPLKDNEGRVTGVHLGSADSEQNANRYATKYCLDNVIVQTDETWWRKKKWEKEQEYRDRDEFYNDLGDVGDEIDVAYGSEGDRGYLAVYNKTKGKFMKLDGLSKTESRELAANLERKLYGKTKAQRALKSEEVKTPVDNAEDSLKESGRTQGRLQETPILPTPQPTLDTTQTLKEPVGNSQPLQLMKKETATSPAIVGAASGKSKRKHSRKRKTSSQSSANMDGPTQAPPPSVEPIVPTLAIF